MNHSKNNKTGPTDYPGYHACTLVAGCNNLIALGDLGCSVCISKVVHGTINNNSRGD